MCLEPPDLSDLDETDEEVDTELLSLLKLQSGEGEGVRVGAAHGSHHPWATVPATLWYPPSVIV